LTVSPHDFWKGWKSTQRPCRSSAIPTVQSQTQVVHWQRARLYPKQEAAIFERKRISVIEASTKSGKTDPACSMVGGVTSARSA
jgi:hypothetical protein